MSTIDLLKQQYRFKAEQAYAQELSNVITTDLTNEQAS